MERVSASITATKHRIPKTLSAGSLDVGQLIADANAVQNASLLSESVTYVSDLSCSSEILPAFPVRSFPDIATVSLGEHLNMFPGTATTPPSRIMLASPTSPRLRSMCKECLSIGKWAEYSRGWDAPGHVPWENTLEHSTRKWLPEGSLFSSESFSRALFRSRNCRPNIKSDSSCPDDLTLVDLNSEMREMMRELHSLRSYFAETLPDDPDLNSSHRPPVPALVVSTSYMTFPLTSLESSQNISTSAIAPPRDRKPLPPLVIQKENFPFAILDPEIPTTSFGCHVSNNLDLHPPVTTGLEISETLRVEEMISNLRFQCSNMLPTHSPSVNDTSWNSRSPLPSEPKHSNATKKQTSAESSTDPRRDKAYLSSPTPRIRPPESRLKGKLIQPKFMYKKRTSTDLSSSQLAPARKLGKLGASQHGASMSSTVTVQKFLRSAMAKDGNNRSKKPYQMVRFALPRSEVAKDLAFSPKPPLVHQPLSTTYTSNDANPKVILPPDDTPKPVPPSPMTSIPVRKENGRLPISGSSPLSGLKMRTRSLSITPFRKIILRRSVELKAPTTESDYTKHTRRSHTLGAHSLSRIIKGPILALKENKRATISLDSTTSKTSYGDEKWRRSADKVQGNSKKTRIPIHIKGLLTRFK